MAESINDNFPEAAPEPAGMERVLALGLEGYRELPDTKFWLVAKMLHAIATDPNPNEMLMDALYKPLSEKNATRMRETLNRLNEQLTPPDGFLTLSDEDVQEIWDDLQGVMGGLIYALVDDKQNEIPVENRYFSTYLTIPQQEELKEKLEGEELPFYAITLVTESVNAALKDPEIQKLVFSYRAELRNNPDRAKELLVILFDTIEPIIEVQIQEALDEYDEDVDIVSHYFANYLVDT